jgi:DNA-binding CsgD family transcriptional regulator
MKYQTENDNLKAVVTFLERENIVHEDLGAPSLSTSDIIASIFSPGEYYYFILNFFNFSIEYLHPTVEKIYGCKPEEFSLEYFFSRMHPDDAAQMKLKEAAAAEFFYNRIPPSKILRYKSSYTFRIQDENGKWKNILHQCTPVQLSNQGRIHHSLSVHTDVSFMNLLPDDRISFIGIGGEPSYYSLSTDPEKILEPEAAWFLSLREREIVKLMGEGMSSKQISDYLSISTHTVDTHRRNLLKKTGTKNTLELTVACVKKGLV